MRTLIVTRRRIALFALLIVRNRLGFAANPNVLSAVRRLNRIVAMRLHSGRGLGREWRLAFHLFIAARRAAAGRMGTGLEFGRNRRCWWQRK